MAAVENGPKLETLIFVPSEKLWKPILLQQEDQKYQKEYQKWKKTMEKIDREKSERSIPASPWENRN
ncbi:MAG: hypothetical protein HUJ74_02105, partial [Lachnospiraceae bacterium]|nr:hypothetical protein [Lachnospiraceae bacterium]